MLVIYVITGVIGFVIYTLVKIKFEDWLEESRMSRLSLKKHQSPNKEFERDNVSLTSPNNIIEISDDESDTPENIQRIIETDKENLRVFQQSTDSIETDEDVEQPVFPSGSKSNSTSVFNWNSKSINANKNSLTMFIDSDTSDDSYQEQKCFQRKQKRFKASDTAGVSSESETKEDIPLEVRIQYEQMISGIKVKLPVKPYSCQLAVMSKLIQGCVKQENCLLESPTGSGKTLALLCSVLAWHDHHTAKINEESKTMTNGGGDHDLWTSYEDAKCLTDDMEEMGEEVFLKNALEKSKQKIPKIYYGTRTHKQIEQVVRELRKTSYTHKKMTILSSREHTCIQDSTRNKTELCNDLLDPMKHKGCPFYNERNKKTLATFSMAERYGLGPVWDIEDLVAIGKDTRVCAYFAARSLMEYADIIFCPYNYIIDPDIRESMQLDLKNQVIILDEAHNIEDICREVASVNFREDYLSAAAYDCEHLAKQRKSNTDVYNTLMHYMLNLVKFLKTFTLNKTDYHGDTLSSPYWTGTELLELLNMNGLGESIYSKIIEACKTAILDVNKAKDEIRLIQTTMEPIISNGTKIVIEHLMFALRMITSENSVNDYRACVTECTVKDFKHIMEDTWHSSKKQENRARTLKLLCMNPGVIFAKLAKTARCIILASGTLTPTASFQSELDTKFVHVLNTAHVIPKEQVYATSIPKGPSGVSLKANYQNVNSWGFQDELGKVLLDICESVPHGILCFFSSYHVMHTQMERWKNNSILSKISNTKEVFIEPRYGGDLALIMNDYRELIEQTSDGPRGNINGALFLAVFRGKVAEGIDFKDNEARCVVTVGIPYAVRKDPVIDMKLKYNDMNTARGLLKGSEWYCIQAYRALNQALGRCLRHINDWGAVLLVDERFSAPDSRNNLPKWVKTMWVHRNEYQLREDLSAFVATQKARERKK